MEIKSALQIAQERAEKIESEAGVNGERLAASEKIKEILAKFFREEFDADQLWRKLNDEDPELLKEAQINLVDSLGLRSTEIDFSKRAKGILAIESIKEDGNTSKLERILDQIKTVIGEYEHGRKKIAEQLQNELENNTQFRMRPVQTPDGRTVMQMDPSIDEKLQKKIQDSLASHEERCRTRFERLIIKVKSQIV